MTKPRAFLVIVVLAVVWLLMSACAHAVLPPIPEAIPSPLGPVPVVWKDSLADEDGRALFGMVDIVHRVIFINAAMRPNRAAALAILVHERCHLALFDTGYRQIVTPDVADALCDVFAMMYVQDRMRWHR